MDERAFVTGSAGFLGRHLLARLAADGVPVTTYDRQHGQDIGDLFTLSEALDASEATTVYHLAALADVRSAFRQPVDQREQNFLGTANVLDAMRACGVKRIVFTSSAVVYGDVTSGLISESDAVGRQTSIYGAVKLASEALIEAYCAGYGMRADIFRLVSATGEGYRHGNILDFYQKLKADPTQIHLLGTGREQKYYIYAGDVIAAMRAALAVDHGGAERWNVSGDTPITIDDVVNEVIDAMDYGLSPEPVATYEHATWTGDLPGLVLDTQKLRGIGWRPTLSVQEGIQRTVQWFQETGL
jgi:UDP-glucose 4-epimerase